MIVVDRPISILDNPLLYAAVSDAAGQILVEVGQADKPETWRPLNVFHLYVDCAPLSRAASVVVALRTGAGTQYAARCAVPKMRDPGVRPVYFIFLVEPVLWLLLEGQEHIAVPRGIHVLPANLRLLGIQIEHVADYPSVSG